MSYSPLATANSFITLANRRGRLIEHMKLQKLVYCANGWRLARNANNGTLVSESPQAWQYGPVFESLYHVLKKFGLEGITSPQYVHPLTSPPIVPNDDSAVVELLEWVWRRYEHLSAWELSELTHREGTPWHEIAVKYGGAKEIPPGQVIPMESIKREFERLDESASVT